MIIATIGHTDYQLDSIKDAETLLNLLGRATIIRSTYFSDHGNVYYEYFDEKKLVIEIISKELVSEEELAEIKKQATEKEKSKAGSA